MAGPGKDLRRCPLGAVRPLRGGTSVGADEVVPYLQEEGDPLDRGLLRSLSGTDAQWRYKRAPPAGETNVILLLLSFIQRHAWWYSLLFLSIYLEVI
jgi:hypothetical protein